MEKLHQQLMAVPARRVAADSKRLCWWALGGTLAVFVSPVLLLCLLDVEFSAAIAAFSAVLALAGLAGFFGVIAGIVPRPSLDDDAIEEATRRRARLRLKVRVPQRLDTHAAGLRRESAPKITVSTGAKYIWFCVRGRSSTICSFLVLPSCMIRRDFPEFL